ncbi:MAG: radical SAM protein [Nanoarchaeota archaeon]|nr:radical SAM protein [Nanoarchaeota archaeon]MBU1270417.1 radical SAM protein [Nanoarchaeota archaeon]MBU1604853.1 radical SAM protein [Nanoarchaeota archaeon]MBU2442459.1 radical SAM protein [Nanoarchaeota archaeon]
MNQKAIKTSQDKKITLPKDDNYLAIFLTFACPRTCSYCLNEQGDGLKQRPIVEGEKWIRALNSLETKLTLTFNGGEPLSHPDFYNIVNGLDESIKVDLLTTLPYNPAEFIENLSPERFERDLPYAAIRVTYHSNAMDLEETIEKVRRIKEAGFDIEINLVGDPQNSMKIRLIKEKVMSTGLGCVIKPFLGYLDGTLYGQFRYGDSCTMKSKKKVKCLTTQLLIDPTGDVYRCYGDLFRQNPEGVLGDIFDPEVDLSMRYTDCHNFGFCHPCDVQIKFDRFSNWGYTAVEIVGNGVTSVKSSRVDWG